MAEDAESSRNTTQRVAALLLAGSVVALVAATRDANLALRAALAIAFPLVVVCLAGELASGTHNLLGVSFAKVPVSWIRFAGWFALLGVSASWILYLVPRI